MKIAMAFFLLLPIAVLAETSDQVKSAEQAPVEAAPSAADSHPMAGHIRRRMPPSFDLMQEEANKKRKSAN